MPRSRALLLYPHTMQLLVATPTLVWPNYSQRTLQAMIQVLLHRPQSTIAQSSNLPWRGNFKVIKTNDVMSQVQNENGDTAWIHRAHIRRLKLRPAHLPHIPPPTVSHSLKHSGSLVFTPFRVA